VLNLNTNIYEFIREFIDRLLEILGLKKPEEKVEYKEEKKVEYKVEKKEEKKEAEEKAKQLEAFRNRCNSIPGAVVYYNKCPEGYVEKERYDVYVCCYIPYEYKYEEPPKGGGGRFPEKPRPLPT